MKYPLLAASIFAAIPSLASSHDITSATESGKEPAFDITHTSATMNGHLTTFMMELAGVAGSVKPQPIGRLKGAKVQAYVWPTSLDPSVVGFDKKSGILALAITAHPDFDDTPLFDENADGDPANDGAGWHSHWVVLTKDTACDAGLKVRDVSPGNDLLPATAPGLPIALDSPGMSPIFNGRVATVTVPVNAGENASFDAVTAQLEVNKNGAAPLLCVTSVHDVASGDLSLPGKIMPAK